MLLLEAGWLWGIGCLNFEFPADGATFDFSVEMEAAVLEALFPSCSLSALVDGRDASEELSAD